MALGGGTFLTQNKTLPGAYINFVSLPKNDVTLAERGYAAMAFKLDWGIENEVFTVTNEDFQKNSMKIFGYDYTNENLKPLREIFKNIHTLYCYRLGVNKKAECVAATAKHGGSRGNMIKVTVSKNLDKAGTYSVSTYFDGIIMDIQTVSSSEELTNNDYVCFKTFDLSTNCGEFIMQGGSNGEAVNSQHQDFLDKLESYRFNALGLGENNEQLKDLYTAYTKRMRDETGVKFQCVLFDKAADYEGIINAKDSVELIPWITGAAAGCSIKNSCLNKKYDGEYEITPQNTQAELEASIKNGEFVFHKVGNEIRVLSDINSLVSISDTKGSIFKENQTVRVCDQIAVDISAIFNTKYLGRVPNDIDGRISFKSEIVKHHQNLADLRAIENFNDDDIQVLMGDTKNSVVVYDCISIVNSMSKLYMTVKIA